MLSQSSEQRHNHIFRGAVTSCSTRLGTAFAPRLTAIGWRPTLAARLPAYRYRYLALCRSASTAATVLHSTALYSCVVPPTADRRRMKRRGLPHSSPLLSFMQMHTLLYSNSRIKLHTVYSYEYCICHDTSVVRSVCLSLI